MTRCNIKEMVLTQLVCQQCTRICEIQRKKSKLKKRGHIKTMYCSGCMEVTDHVELGPEER